MQVISQAPAAASLTIAAGAATATFNVIAGEPGAGTQCNLNLPGSNRLNGQPFKVRAAGFLSLAAGTFTSAATPLQVVLNASNTASFAAASGNAIASLTAVAAFTWTSAVAGGLDWEVEAELIGSNVSGKMTGYVFGNMTNPNGVPTNTTSAATAQSPSSVNYATEPPVQFAVSIISAAANLLAGPVASLSSFQVEA